jgi:hypothetical protein
MRRQARLATSLGVDALEPGLVDACGAAAVAVGDDDGGVAPAGHLQGEVAAAPSSVRPAAWREFLPGNREEPGTLTQGGALFSLGTT